MKALTLGSLTLFKAAGLTPEDRCYRLYVNIGYLENQCYHFYVNIGFEKPMLTIIHSTSVLSKSVLKPM